MLETFIAAALALYRTDPRLQVVMPGPSPETPNGLGQVAPDDYGAFTAAIIGAGSLVVTDRAYRHYRNELERNRVNDPPLKRQACITPVGGHDTRKFNPLSSGWIFTSRTVDYSRQGGRPIIVQSGTCLSPQPQSLAALLLNEQVEYNEGFPFGCVKRYLARAPLHNVYFTTKEPPDGGVFLLPSVNGRVPEIP